MECIVALALSCTAWGILIVRLMKMKKGGFIDKWLPMPVIDFLFSCVCALLIVTFIFGIANVA